MSLNSSLFIRDLGDGLILRRASAEDVDALAEMNSLMHGDGPGQPNPRIGIWTRDLLTKPHPTLVPGDFTLVEETATGRIVSTLCLIPQTWMYEDIEFGIGRPELVSTLPEFRNRGLVRIQMEEVHKWSEERGHFAQFITGIPYFYRQFGYDMTLDLAGRRYGFEANLPILKEGQPEPYLLRPAVEADVEFIAQLYSESKKRYAIFCKRPAEIIRYEMSVQSPDSIIHYDLAVVEDVKGERVGYIQHTTELWNGGVHAVTFEIVRGASWLEIAPSVARYLWKKAGEYAERDSLPRTSFGFHLGEYHPVYESLDDRLPALRKPYAYYMRVPNLPGFLWHIRPALEKRLAESVAAGFSGELRVGFYRDGLLIRFERGQIAAVEPLKVTSGVQVDANFPELTFLHLVFAYRSFDELHHMFADCYWENNTARVLLNALFPKKLSAVYPVF
ncbi:MAG TPA: GNAT family N-acetyltransferase [Anaerolineales bacterium]|nr:GNAT family N-acetyltransferase [Anaerolineales bacterium]HNN12094.1 GNAT family N-acetyltransferase [Anaerolineales bacterium]